MERVKKRVLSTCFLWAAALVLSLSVPSKTAIVHAETMVYVTPTGTKYHSRQLYLGNVIRSFGKRADAMQQMLWQRLQPRPGASPCPTARPGPSPAARTDPCAKACENQ